MASASDWTRFFTLAGIPDRIAARYAQSFASNRVAREQVIDLDKETLVDLGITAVGDQMAILKRARAAGRLDTISAAPVPTKRERISAPTERVVEDDTMASIQRRGKPPPDRHEIYHVKMPQGSTAKTRRILEHSAILRDAGYHSRGTSGVRQAGRAVLSIAEQREREQEVSSTTDRFGGLHADRLRGRLTGVQAGRVLKKQIVMGNSGGGRSALFSSAIADAGRKPSHSTLAQRVQGGGKMPSVTVHLGGGGGRLAVTNGGAQRVPVTQRIGGRAKVITRVVGGGGGRNRGGVKRVYADELDEEVVMDDGEEMYDDDGEQLIDDMIEEVEGVQYVDELGDEEYIEEEEEDDNAATLVVSGSGRSRRQAFLEPTQRRTGGGGSIHSRISGGNVRGVGGASVFERVSF